MHKFHHSNEQRQALIEELSEIATKILSLDFDNPEVDEKMIRHHAYLKGQYYAVSRILRDEYDNPLPTSESET